MSLIVARQLQPLTILIVTTLVGAVRERPKRSHLTFDHHSLCILTCYHNLNQLLDGDTVQVGRLVESGAQGAHLVVEVSKVHLIICR